MAGRTLVVANDFPPRVGGIESFVLAMVRRLPPDQVVQTARQSGDAVFDETLPLPVVRDCRHAAAAIARLHLKANVGATAAAGWRLFR